MLNVLIKESYAMPSCLYNEHIQILPSEGGKQGASVRGGGDHRKPVVLVEANKIRHSGQIVRVFYVLCPVFSFNLPKSIY